MSGIPDISAYGFFSTEHALFFREGYTMTVELGNAKVFDRKGHCEGACHEPCGSHESFRD